MASRMGFRLLPRSVRLYSTRGGTSAYTFRLTSPFASMSRSWAVSTFWDTLPMDFLSSPNRRVYEPGKVKDTSAMKEAYEMGRRA